MRLTGPDTYRIVAHITRREQGQFKPRQAIFTPFYNPHGEAFDAGILLPFFAPHSYTGEDLAEFYLHGNPHLVRIMLETCMHYGAHPADPGAFTRRAVLSGRMGVMEVESLAELMEAVTPVGAGAALKGVQGELRRFFLSLRQQLLELLAQMEARLDFPEEGIEPETLQELGARITSLKATLEDLLRASRRMRVFVQGATLVIAGAPNVGKSTLLNALLGEERAIVSATPGTTRDYLESLGELKGIPLKLVDTAGIRRATDPIEAEGIERTRKKLAEADLILWLRSPVDEEDPEVGELLKSLPEETVLELWNKRDLAPPPRPEVLAISARDPEDLARLKEVLAQRLSPPREPLFLTSLRQEAHARAALAALGRARTAILEGRAEELIAEELREARDELARLLGEIHPEEILEQIFSRFCIGK